MAWAVGFWLLWTLVTWWLEGRIETFRRPGAVADRLLYTAVANVLIAVVGGAVLLRRLQRSRPKLAALAGFGPRWRTLAWVPAGLALGGAGYFVQGAPSTEPVVFLNAYAQVFVVSMAEIVVCWSIVGGAIAAGIDGSKWRRVTAAIVVASISFGVYHIAHSPPFNSLDMIAFLSAIGLVTSAFFFVSRDVYGTIFFHNFLGVFGVVQALAAQDAESAYETLQLPLLAMAVVALGILVAVDVLLIRRHSA